MSNDDYREAHTLIDGLSPAKARLAALWLRALAGESDDRSGNFGLALGVRFTEFAGGRCACEAEAGEAHWNPHGIVHGGLLFALADWAMGGAVTTADLQPGERPVTRDIHIRFHRALRRGKLSANAHVIQRDERMATLEAVVNGEDGRALATATGTFSILRKPGAASG